jgi:hypothetical protein
MKALQLLLLITLLFAGKVQGQTDRELWVNELVKMADPVLTSLSNQKLRTKMPLILGANAGEERRTFAQLEAFGRLMAGIAPWLELGPDDTEEGQLRAKYILLTRKCIANAVNPESKDFMNFSKGYQPLVDAAFLAQAFLRAPKQIWEPLDEVTKQQVIDAFLATRKITPWYNNWLLFSATIEAFLAEYTDKADMMRIDYAIRKHQEWYIGDGHYTDGQRFHWDYYNSYVIQPMLIDISAVLKKHYPNRFQSVYDRVMKHSKRYATILERMISPEGTYPVIGRSSVYRIAAFQPLSQLALMDSLPDKLSYGQVRSGLTAVMNRVFSHPNTYDDNDWLKIGMVGEQTMLAESYINTGSIYLTSTGFLHLGLPEDHSFWTEEPEPWSMKKIWRGDKDVLRDKATH